jgi:hypothetical protein
MALLRARHAAVWGSLMGWGFAAPSVSEGTRTAPVDRALTCLRRARQAGAHGSMRLLRSPHLVTLGDQRSSQCASTHIGIEPACNNGYSSRRRWPCKH